MVAELSGIKFTSNPYRNSNPAGASSANQCCGGNVCFCGKGSNGSRSYGQQGPNPAGMAHRILYENQGFRQAEATYDQVGSRLYNDVMRHAHFAGMNPIQRQLLSNQFISGHVATKQLAQFARQAAQGAANDLSVLGQGGFSQYA